MKRVALLLALVTAAFTQQQQEICDEFIDAVIVVDGSDSIAPVEEKYINGLAKIASRFDISGSNATSGVQLGICAFGTGYEEVVPLSLRNTPGSVNSRILNVFFPGGRTQYSEGLQCAINNFNRAGRSGANQTVLLIVDGNPDIQDEPQTDAFINYLKNEGTIVSMLAVGAEFRNITSLPRLASDPVKLFMNVTRFEDFERNTNAFFSIICP